MAEKGSSCTSCVNDEYFVPFRYRKEMLLKQRFERAIFHCIEMTCTMIMTGYELEYVNGPTITQPK